MGDGKDRYFKYACRQVFLILGATVAIDGGLDAMNRSALYGFEYVHGLISLGRSMDSRKRDK